MNEDSVLTVSATFGLDPRCVTLSSKKKNRLLYRIYTEDKGGSYCLKGRQVSLGTVQEQLVMLARLREKGFVSFPDYCLSANGIPCVEMCGYVWTLTQWLDQDIYPLHEIAREIGRTIGTLHALSQGVCGKNNGPNLVPGYIKAILQSRELIESAKPKLLKNEVGRQLMEILPLYTKETERLLEHLIKFRELVMSCWNSPREAGSLVHGDISLSNILYTRQSGVMIVDWDDCRVGNRLTTDFVQFYWRIAFLSKDLETSVSQYISTCPSSDNELKLLPLILSPLHILLYCVKRIYRGMWNAEDQTLFNILLSDDPGKVINIHWDTMNMLIDRQ